MKLDCKMRMCQPAKMSARRSFLPGEGLIVARGLCASRQADLENSRQFKAAQGGASHFAIFFYWPMPRLEGSANPGSTILNFSFRP
jgi:hypothetical protein